tara:strand:- start:47 stop:472 length:426 start_codon:yes stop_codon:yes gene_type:complete
MSTNTYIDPTYNSPLHKEVRQWILDNIDTIDDGCECQKVPSIRMTDEMKQEQRMLHLGKKRSKQACRNISKSKTLGNHNLAKSFILTSPNDENIIVQKGTMNIVAKKLGLNPNGLRFNASTPRKDGTPRTLKGWVCQELVC